MKSRANFSDAAKMVWLVGGKKVLKAAPARAEKAAHADVDDVLQSAKAAFQSSRFDDCVAACDTIIAQTPTSTGALRLKARALASRGLHSEALAVWQVIGKVAPASTEGHLNAARLEHRAENWPQALAAAMQVIALEPLHPEALSLAGYAFVRVAQPGDGMPIWAGLASINVGLLRDFQLDLEDASRLIDAAGALKALVEVNPSRKEFAKDRVRFVEEVLERGMMREASKDFLGASLAYRAVAVADPDKPQALRLLQKMTRPLIAAGRERLKAGDHAAAGKLFGETLSYTPADLMALTGMARVADATQDWPQSVAMWRRITAIDPADDAAWFRLGTALSRNQEFFEAQEALSRVTNPELKVMAAKSLEQLSRGAFKAAREHLLAGDSETASRLLAVTEAISGSDEAVHKTRERISRSLRVLQKEALLKQDMHRVAALGRQILIDHTSDVSAWTVYARALFATRQMPECLAAWRSVTELEPQRAEALIGIARACLALGRNDESVAAAQTVLTTDPGNLKVRDILTKARRSASATPKAG